MLPWPSSLPMSSSGKVRESPFVIQLPLQHLWGFCSYPASAFSWKVPVLSQALTESTETSDFLPLDYQPSFPIGAESPDRLSYLATVSKLNGPKSGHMPRVLLHSHPILRVSQVTMLPRTRYCPDYLPIGTCSIHKGLSHRTFTWFV